MIDSDSAGDTSRRSGNAPAHSFSGSLVLSASDLVSRLVKKGVRLDDVNAAYNLVELFGYRHAVRYIPALSSTVEDPGMAALAEAIVCDMELQNVVLRYCARLERVLKSRLSVEIAKEFGPLAYTGPSLFKRESDFESFKHGYRGELLRKAKGGSKYAARIASEGADPPIWSACEFASFGTVSKLFSNLVPCESKRNLSLHYGFAVPVLESWLEALVFLRNECSHGGVLYGRELEKQPKSVRELCGIDNRRVFYQLMLLRMLVGRDFPSYTANMAAVLNPVMRSASHRRAFGAPADWEQVLAR